MKLPLKWKIFRFANYFMAFAFLFFLYFLLKFFIKESLEGDDIWWFIGVGTGMILIVLNSIVNLFITYKIFPGKSLQGKTKSIYIISTILYSFALAGLLTFSFYGINEELKDPEPNEDKSGLIGAFSLLFFFFIGCYVLIMQLLIQKFLNANYKKSINSLIDNIGENE